MTLQQASSHWNDLWFAEKQIVIMQLSKQLSEFSAEAVLGQSLEPRVPRLTAQLPL